MMHLSLFVALFIVPAVLADTAGHVEMDTGMCSLLEVEKCTMNLDHLGMMIAPSYDTIKLEETCNKWTSDHKTCVNAVTAACASPTNGNSTEQTTEEIMARKKALQGAGEWSNGYEYLCNEGKTTYEGIVYACMVDSVNLTQMTEECYRTYDNKTWWLDSNEPTNTYRFCKAGKNFIKCLKKAAEDECGLEVAEWIWAYHGQLWLPHFTDIECSLESKFSAGALAIVSICAGAAGAVIIFTLVSFCVKPPDTKKSDGKDDKKAGTKTDKDAKDDGEDNQAFAKENGDLEMSQDNGLTKRTNAGLKAQEMTKM